MEDMVFKQIDVDANNLGVAPFQLEEIRSAVWDCESSKSPGPDGVNLSFIKEFWEVIKHDFEAFLREFQVNGKLVRGTNCS